MITNAIPAIVYACVLAVLLIVKRNYRQDGSLPSFYRWALAIAIFGAVVMAVEAVLSEK